MEIDDIRKLVELMAENDVVEREMEDRKGKILLVRNNHHAPTPVTVVAASPPLQQLAPITVSTTAPLSSVSVPPPQSSQTEAPALEQGI